jgi:Zn-dependent protease/predicted transcriptional regulator
LLSKVSIIRVHYTWIPACALIIAVVTTQLSEGYPLWQRIILGLAVCLFFFAALLIRELILNTAAFRRETPVRKITLFVFGGVYPENRDRMATSRLRLLYSARFLLNLLIAAIFYGLYATFINAENLMMAEAAQWLTYICFLLFVLHFIPAFPLDGGEILRRWLWRSTGDYYKATGSASLIGRAAGFFLIFAGVPVFIATREWVISLLMIFIGWTLAIAAGYTRREIRTHLVLRNIKAEDIMTREYPVMSPQVNIGQLVREHILIKGWPYVIIAEDNKLKGILTLDRIKAVPGRRWNNTTTGDIMTPAAQIRTAYLQQTANTLYEDMYQRNLDYIPVLENENIVGMVNRAALMSLVKTRTGFGI